MKTIINILITFLFSTLIFAQEKPVKIVFDVTSSEASVHESAVKHVKMMAEAYPDSKFEMVMYSGAYGMVVKNTSTVLNQMEELGTIENVDLVVCQASLNRHKIEATQLIAGVRAVPDGILEIIQKQGIGWGYIKEAK
ncbi:hypothetical protein GGR42_000724 [Saonia flava]|uniref:DsrE/DsrF-like family protein n=1 Tax=Saonia flava TaxID=523696 RepID=A0A846QUN5_9FLAO|nr:DsrE family protein [Saonia flava]NJB70262.1 hypothetical protein [Saonia flava]